MLLLLTVWVQCLSTGSCIYTSWSFVSFLDFNAQLFPQIGEIFCYYYLKQVFWHFLPLYPPIPENSTLYTYIYIYVHNTALLFGISCYFFFSSFTFASLPSNYERTVFYFADSFFFMTRPVNLSREIYPYSNWIITKLDFSLERLSLCWQFWLYSCIIFLI
jgi:hypothetical protein